LACSSAANVSLVIADIYGVTSIIVMLDAITPPSKRAVAAPLIVNVPAPEPSRPARALNVVLLVVPATMW
jgi:hypothetical protein